MPIASLDGKTSPNEGEQTGAEEEERRRLILASNGCLVLVRVAATTWKSSISK